MTREKQTEVINAKNRFETDLKTQAEETRRVMEEMRAAHKEQMARMQSEMEAQMHAMRREHSKVVDNYEARDQAWQLEKEVCCHLESRGNYLPPSNLLLFELQHPPFKYNQLTMLRTW